MLAQARKGFFNAENAKVWAAKSVEARRQLKLNPPPPPPPPVVQKVETDHYLSTRLARVREQIDSLEEKLSELLLKGDPIECAAAIDRLCAAKAKLSEEERVLSGRPLPGSLKPRSAPTRRQASDSPVVEDSQTDNSGPVAGQ